MRARVRASILAGIVMSSCSSRLPTPPLVAQTTDALVRVEYPPPPAHVEAIPDPPRDSRAVWIDGEWSWRRGTWLWTRGRWILPPAGARFSPWTIVRGEDGVLWYARGSWRNERGEEVAPPKPLVVGQDVVGVVVDANGNTLRPGRVLDPPGTKKRREKP
jgi:hypothetical protein